MTHINHMGKIGDIINNVIHYIKTNYTENYSIDNLNVCGKFTCRWSS